MLNFLHFCIQKKLNESAKLLIKKGIDTNLMYENKNFLYYCIDNKNITNFMYKNFEYRQIGGIVTLLPVCILFIFKDDISKKIILFQVII